MGTAAVTSANSSTDTSTPANAAATAAALLVAPCFVSPLLLLTAQALEGPGNGRVLVVDGGASNRCALVGDQLAVLAVKNGWKVRPHCGICWERVVSLHELQQPAAAADANMVPMNCSS
jgi:hypothetical protein